MKHDNTAPLTEREIQEALDIARKMIKAGIPVFAAPPCRPDCGMDAHPVGRHHYHLPSHWTKTYPSEVNLEKWKPGWALAAVGGHAGDFLDVDPRADGHLTAEGMKAAGEWPRTFGRQSTPSGGWHDLISATGERKIVLAPGVDLQAGAPDGVGRGFVYISPTVAPSKVTGELVPYRWVEPPDTDQLLEWRGLDGEVLDDSIQHVISRVHAKRSAPPAARPAPEADPADPFMTSSTLTQGTGERTFTMTQAQDFLRPTLAALQAAQVGEIEEKANTAAAALSHFVPAFWSVEEAFGILSAALGQTAYDPDRPGATWRAEKFLRVLDGTRAPLDPWRAVLRAELDPGLFNPDLSPAKPPTTREEALSMVDRLEAMLVTATELAAQPAPVPLVYGLLDLDTESWMIGAPGSFKSFVSLDLAGHVGQGKEWQGHRVRQGEVIYIAAEGSRGMTLRTRAWELEHGTMTGVSFLPMPVQVADGSGQWEALVEVCRRRKPSLVVIDTQARVTVGLEENSAKDFGFYAKGVTAIRLATGACVLTVHHTGRDGQNARGSSAIDGAQDTELKLERVSPRSSLQVKVRQDKQKDMAEEDGGGTTLQLRVVDLGTDPDTERALSSLVIVARDDFVTAQGMEMDSTRPWLPVFHHRDRWKRTILNALYDFAPAGYGLTKSEVRAILVRDAGLPQKSSSFDDAWKAVLELKDPTGEPVVEKVGGERYDLISLAALQGLEDEHGPRGGGAGGQWNTP